MYDYDEIIITNGIKLPFIPHIITPKIEKPIRNNRYEKGELKRLRATIRSGDRVLELGSGIGVISTHRRRSKGSKESQQSKPTLRSFRLFAKRSSVCWGQSFDDGQ